MGYEPHITRAFMSFDSERYPILGSEVEDLVRDEPDLTIPADAPQRPGFCYVFWDSGSPDGDDHLRFDAGRLTTTDPRPGLLRRMTELAARLDAWVIGDDGDVYEWDGSRIINRQRGPEAFAGQPRYITRGTSNSGGNGRAPIRPDEWAALVRGADWPAVRRMAALAAALGASVLDDEDQPAHE